jgi:hypothetical protein
MTTATAVADPTRTVRNLTAPVSAVTWKRTLHLVADLPVAVAAVSAATAALSTSLSLAVLVVGVPLLAVTVTAAAYLGRFEVARTRALLDADLRAPELARYGWGWRGLLRRCVDLRGWLALAYAVVLLPLSLVSFTVLVTGWSFVAAGLTSPIWAPIVGDGGAHLGGVELGGRLGIVATFAAALAAAYLMPVVVRLLAAVDVRLVRALLTR